MDDGWMDEGQIKIINPVTLYWKFSVFQTSQENACLTCIDLTMLGNGLVAK